MQAERQSQQQPIDSKVVAAGIFFAMAGGGYACRRVIARAALRVATSAVVCAATPYVSAGLAFAGTAWLVAEGGGYLLNEYNRFCNQADLNAIIKQINTINLQNQALTLQVAQKNISPVQLQQQKLQLREALNILTQKINQLRQQTASLEADCAAIEEHISQLRIAINTIKIQQHHPAMAA